MIVIVNGTATAGKDTVCNFVREEIGDAFYRNFSTIDCVKEIAKDCGWNGEKTPEARKFLSDLKDLLSDFNDYPFESMKRVIDWEKGVFQENEIDSNRYIIFIHVREPKEIKKFVEYYKNDVQTVLIRRPAVEGYTSNHADRDVLNFNYDHTIWNSGTLDELKLKIKYLLIHLGIKYAKN